MNSSRTIHRTGLTGFLVAGLLLCVPGVASAAEAEIDFNRDVRPILSDKCYFCHGPDAEQRQAELRLDTPEGARDVIEWGEFLERVQSDDPDYRMPPPAAKLSLTAAEKLVLKRWVESGAKYERHWAFEELPESVPVPKVSDTSWPRQPLDRFVLAKLEAEGLQPSAAGDPMRWLRRVSFDLTGLPPTPAEIEQFKIALESDRQAAFETVVDRLLASSAYGEHMAVAWLDAARYADSYGYQSDKLNTQWPYRDWVVRAFNENLPYDKFLVWQMAGDLLDNPTRDQRLATAFNRLHRLNNEGGAVYEEWRQENVADRVHTFGTAVLGLTLECTRCHDHKFDPISQRDYYSLSAFFNSIDESGVYDHTEKVPSPTLLLPTEEQTAALEAARAKLAAAEADYQRALQLADERRTEWLAAHADEPLTLPDRVVALTFDRPFDESMSETCYPVADILQRTEDLEYAAVEDSPIPRLAPATGECRAIRLDGERGVVVQGVEPIDRWTPFSLVLSFRDTERSPLRSLIAQHSRGTDTGYNGWDLTIDGGHVESRLYRVWPGNAIGVRTLKPLPADQWCQLAATYDGSSTAEGLKLYLNGELLETELLRDAIVKSANFDAGYGGQLVLGQRFRSRGFSGGLIDDLQYFCRDLTPSELQHLATGAPLELTPDYFAAALDAESRQAALELRAARQALVMAEEVIHEVPIMEELPTPRPAHILARGLYDAPTSDETLVTRDTFATILPKFPADAPRDRLGLARWVTQPRHPLTARVLVNRLWSNFFGAGLVRTPENYGLQGELPTHPALLDWLSLDLTQQGWDMKRLCRNVALSATYRQESTASSELLERDPENRLLARGPASRLASEQVRDLALAAAGMLDRQRGGPPVSPYQPGGDLWRESNSMSPPYEQSVGRSLYRRSLYSVWKRTAPLPNMMTFDATSREVCTVSRSRTNTPLQALVLLNDVQFVEAARNLATTVLAEESEDPRRIAAAFLALAGREPDATENQLLLELLAAERDYYQSHPHDAQQLLDLGDSPPASEFAPADAAAMTIVCQAILNLDATIWKR